HYDRAEEIMDEIGEAILASDKYLDAIDDLTIAITIDPEYADAYFSRGSIYDRADKKKEAIADYGKLLKLTNHKTDKEILNAFLKHYNPTRQPLADPLTIAKPINEARRELIKKRLKELKSEVKDIDNNR
ncbi:hypothetical protein ACFLYQ_07860, partial [Chloroflexota bacterium]